MESRIKKLFHRRRDSQSIDDENLQQDPQETGPVARDQTVGGSPYYSTTSDSHPTRRVHIGKDVRDSSATAEALGADSSFNRSTPAPHLSDAPQLYSRSLQTVPAASKNVRQVSSAEDGIDLSKHMNQLEIGEGEDPRSEKPPDVPRHAPVASSHRKTSQLESDMLKEHSIYRKQVGSHPLSPTAPVHSSPSSTPPTNYSRQASLDNPLPAKPRESRANTPRNRRNDYGSEKPDTYNRSTRMSNAHDHQPAAEEVVSRAKSNTHDTEVIERIAPAVVHETIHKDVHHVREEIITREIHNHEYYHRILPVTDVEILPPRHFLPVAGGGLVEVSAADVPGRGNNWVIAETASKIPSDERAPRGPNLFSAREFSDDEGDTQNYKTPEGYQRTEQTWIHPPELETGGRDTQQTWPFEFEKQKRNHHHHSAGKRREARNLTGDRTSY